MSFRPMCQLSHKTQRAKREASEQSHNPSLFYRGLIFREHQAYRSWIVISMLLSRRLLSMFLLLSAEVAVAGNLPSPNPLLADSHNAMAHNDPAQQDAVSLAGPSGPSRRLSPEEIQYLHTCLLYTSPSPRDYAASRMPSSA